MNYRLTTFTLLALLTITAGYAILLTHYTQDNSSPYQFKEGFEPCSSYKCEDKILLFRIEVKK